VSFTLNAEGATTYDYIQINHLDFKIAMHVFTAMSTSNVKVDMPHSTVSQFYHSISNLFHNFELCFLSIIFFSLDIFFNVYVILNENISLSGLLFIS
jgi:hypothetical protein